MGAWSGKRIAKIVEVPPEIGIEPNGVDLGVSEVRRISVNAVAILHGELREVKPTSRIFPDRAGFYRLVRGIYEVRLANRIEVPKNAVALLHPRSSLNRLGMIKSQSGIVDSGYSGFTTQTVYVPIKLFRIHSTERWFQLTVMDAESSGSYRGHWHGERPKRGR